MNTKIYFINPEETREEKEYYSPYNALLEEIDKTSGIQMPVAKWYPPHIDPLDELAIDVIGNIENQLCVLDRESGCITIDLWECIPEILGYDRDLEDGNLLTKAIYLLSTEVTSLLKRHKMKGKTYYDVWYINQNGNICINIVKEISQIPTQSAVYSLQSDRVIADNNAKSLQGLIMPSVLSAVENNMLIKVCAINQLCDSTDISSLLLEAQKFLNPYNCITHGLSLIIFLRCLQLHVYEQISLLKQEGLNVPYTTRWFVEEDECDGFGITLSVEPEL